MKKFYLTPLLVVILFIVSPAPVNATSATQASNRSCNRLFGLDFKNTTSNLYTANADAPNTIQLYASKVLGERPRQQRLIQLRSGKFGVIYHNRAVVKYTTFDPDSPISTVWTPPGENTSLNYPSVVELADGTLIAGIEYTPDTRAERLTEKSTCFDGLTGMAHCTQDVRVAILKSSDSGQNWTPVTILDNDLITVARRGSFWQPRLAIDSNDYLYLLVVEQYFDPNPDNQKRDTQTLWKSVNRGVTWTRVSNVFTAPLPHYQANEGDLVITPSGNITVVFNSNYYPGAVAGSQGDYILITSSSDHGRTWSKVKTVGKFGPNKGPSRVPEIQLIGGNRYGITFHKFIDPNYINSYLFSQPNSLVNWSEDFPVEPLDPGVPNVHISCVRPITELSPTPPPGNPADLVDTGDELGNQVNEYDYNQLVGDFGKTGAAGWIKADIVQNGKVDEFDYNALVENFGK